VFNPLETTRKYFSIHCSPDCRLQRSQASSVFLLIWAKWRRRWVWCIGVKVLTRET